MILLIIFSIYFFQFSIRYHNFSRLKYISESSINMIVKNIYMIALKQEYIILKRKEFNHSFSETPKQFNFGCAHEPT